VGYIDKLRPNFLDYLRWCRQKTEGQLGRTFLSTAEEDFVMIKIHEPWTAEEDSQSGSPSIAMPLFQFENHEIEDF
jgi:hypothetical protein